MQEYYKQVHDEALSGMRRIVGQEVEDSAPTMLASQSAAAGFKASAADAGSGQ